MHEYYFYSSLLSSSMFVTRFLNDCTFEGILYHGSKLRPDIFPLSLWEMQPQNENVNLGLTDSWSLIGGRNTLPCLITNLESEGWWRGSQMTAYLPHLNSAGIHLDTASLNWTLMISPEHCWSFLDTNVIHWTLLVSPGYCWSQLDIAGLNWILLVSTGH